MSVQPSGDARSREADDSRRMSRDGEANNRGERHSCEEASARRPTEAGDLAVLMGGAWASSRRMFRSVVQVCG